MIVINSHLPILQIIISLFGALLTAASFNKKLAELIAVIVVAFCFALSIYIFHNTDELRYALGNWQAPIGIEYRLDFLNSPLFIFVNGYLLFLLVFCRHLIETTVLTHINKTRQHLFFSCLLFAHTGFLGLISTNDLFNYYVFIEISSLSAYVLMAQGGDIYASRGAFDYLIIGSTGATLILIGIGLMLSITGSLNIDDIRLQLEGMYNSRLVVAACCFIVVGIFLKMAFFPMHFWIVRAYNSAACVILIYLASISGVIGTYSYLRFIRFALDYNIIQTSFESILKLAALTAIIACVYFASKAQKLKNIIIYSAASQIGYVVFLLSLESCNKLVFHFLILDLINKVSLFLICAKHEERQLKASGFEYCFIALTLICSAGLPLSGMFLVKINILEQLFVKNYLIESIIIVLGSAGGFIYHYKMAKILFLQKRYKGRESFDLNPLNTGCICLIFLQIFMLSSQNWIDKYSVWQFDFSKNAREQNLK